MIKKSLLMLVVLSMFFTLSYCNNVKGQDGIIVHITADPATENGQHRIGMAFGFAQKAIDSGKKVLVFFSIDGVKVPLKQANDISLSKGGHQFPSSKKAIKELIEKGAIVMSCPACTKAAGYKMEDLMEGVKPGDIKPFTEFTDGRIVTMTW